MLELREGPGNQLPSVLFFNQPAFAGSSRNVAWPGRGLKPIRVLSYASLILPVLFSLPGMPPLVPTSFSLFKVTLVVTHYEAFPSPPWA